MQEGHTATGLLDPLAALIVLGYFSFDISYSFFDEGIMAIGQVAIQEGDVIVRFYPELHIRTTRIGHPAG